MAKSHIYQLCPDEAARAAVDARFVALSPQPDDRPDWREYATIVRHLRGTRLEPGELYAFLGPRFAEDTNVAPHEVTEFVDRVGENVDVVSFSPHPDQHSLFWNLFEQGDYQVPGNAQLCQEIINALGFKADVTEMVMDSRNSIFRNAFAAKPVFWERWLDVTGRIMALADGPASPLRDRLNLPMPFRADSPDLMMGQVKLFVLERVPSLVLALHPELKAISYQPFLRPRTNSAFAEFPLESVLSDALKIAYNVQGDIIFKSAFGHIRDQVKAAMDKKLSG